MSWLLLQKSTASRPLERLFHDLAEHRDDDDDDEDEDEDEEAGCGELSGLGAVALVNELRCGTV